MNSSTRCAPGARFERASRLAVQRAHRATSLRGGVTGFVFAAGVLLAVALSIAGAGCGAPDSQKAPRARRPPVGDMPGPGWSHRVRTSTGSGFTLVPLPPTGERDAKHAEQLARDLFQKLAQDPDSQSLLSRLYGRLPVEVVSLDGMKAFDEDAVNHARPKTDGAAVLLSLHVAQPGKELSYHGDIAEVYGYQWAYSSTFSLGSFVRQRSDDSSVPLTAEEALQYDPEDQDDRPLLWIVANDYLLRHERPWQVIIQAGDLPHRKASADAAELRAEVNRQLESLAPAHEKTD